MSSSNTKNIAQLWIIFLLSFAILTSFETLDGSSIIPFWPYLLICVEMSGIFVIFYFIYHKNVFLTNIYSLLGLIILSLLVLMGIASSAWSSLPELTIQRAFLILPTVVIYSVAMFDEDTQATIICISTVFFSLGVILSLISLITYYVGYVDIVGDQLIQVLKVGPLTITQHLSGNMDVIKLASFFGNSNTFSQLLVVSIASTFYLVLVSRLHTLTFAFSILPQGSALLLTRSRAAVGALSTILILFSIAHYSRNTKTKRESLSIGIFGYVFVALPGIFVFILGFFPEIASRRAEAWLLALNNFGAEPIVGYGFGISTEVISQELGMSLHNSYLIILSELGVVGFSIFTVLIFMNILALSRGMQHSNTREYYSVIYLLSLLLSMYFIMLFSTSLFRFGGYYHILWTIVLSESMCYYY